MHRIVRSTAQLTLLAVIVGTVGGCGTGNPVGPSAMIDASTMSTQREAAQIESPELPETGRYGPAPSDPDPNGVVARKKERRARRQRGNGHGHGNQNP